MTGYGWLHVGPDTVTWTWEILACRDGAWCPACNLPSACTLTCAVTFLGQCDLVDVTACLQCGYLLDP